MRRLMLQGRGLLRRAGRPGCESSQSSRLVVRARAISEVNDFIKQTVWVACSPVLPHSLASVSSWDQPDKIQISTRRIVSDCSRHHPLTPCPPTSSSCGSGRGSIRGDALGRHRDRSAVGSASQPSPPSLGSAQPLGHRPQLDVILPDAHAALIGLVAGEAAADGCSSRVNPSNNIDNRHPCSCVVEIEDICCTGGVDHHRANAHCRGRRRSTLSSIDPICCRGIAPRIRISFRIVGLCSQRRTYTRPLCHSVCARHIPLRHRDPSRSVYLHTNRGIDNNSARLCLCLCIPRLCQRKNR